MSHADRHVDVAVVGAGLAGLAAARELQARGVTVLVMEARDRVGGRTYTKAASDGTLLDLGGQWIGPSQHRLAALAKAVGATTFRTYDSGKNVQYRQGERLIYSGVIPMNDAEVAMETVEHLVTLNDMAHTVPLDAPWMAASAAAWDAQTVATWIDANVMSDGAKWLLTLVVRSVFSVEPRDLSLLHFLFYVHSGGSINELVGVTRGAQESRFHNGAQSVANKVAQALGDRVMLNTPVHAIAQDGGGIRVISDDLSVTAERAIVAIPPTLAGRIRYVPEMPALRDQLTQRMPMGTVIKVQCVYPTPFWREEGLSGQATSDTGLVSITYDNTPEGGVPGVLLGFIEADEGRTWGNRSLAERRDAVIACLVNYFGAPAAHPTEYVEHNWANEVYSRGCYAGYMPPGVWTAYGAALREPVGRIHWAGTETATIWNGYMDGAVQSGERAAAEVLAALERS